MTKIVEAVAAAEVASEPLLVMAGGSNLVARDAGFEGTVIRILTQGGLSDCKLRSPAAGGRGGRARGLSARLGRRTRRDLENATLELVNRGGASTF